MRTDAWSGQLFHSDCLVLLERIPSDFAQIVYLDPPWFPELPGDEDLPAYMRYLSLVLQQARRVLKDSGSLFFHSKPSLAGSIRFTLDHVFNANTFVDEVVLPLPMQTSSMRRGQKHDTIYIYGKSTQPTLYFPSRPRTEEEIKMLWPLTNDDGRHYRLESLLQSGHDRPMQRYEWHGYIPPEDRIWRFSQEQMDELWDRCEITISSNVLPRRKVFVDEAASAPIGSVWSDIMRPHILHKDERVCYPTQKPILLMNRIIEMGTEVGDLVLDPFCGSGTTILAAQSLKRRWIGGDKNDAAIQTTTARLSPSGHGAELTKVVTMENLIRSFPVVDQEYRNVMTVFEDFVGTDEPFRLNHALPVEETRHIEFKEVMSGNPVSAIKNKVDEYVVAFLNSGGGGRIFWGVRDADRIVNGVRLEPSQRDELRKDITSKLSQIQPAVDPTLYHVLLHDVVDGYRKVPNMCVVEVAVPRVESSIPYATGSGEVYAKTDSGKRKLTHLELVAWIKSRLVATHHALPNALSVGGDSESA